MTSFTNSCRSSGTNSWWDFGAKLFMLCYRCFRKATLSVYSQSERQCQSPHLAEGAAKAFAKGFANVFAKKIWIQKIKNPPNYKKCKTLIMEFIEIIKYISALFFNVFRFSKQSNVFWHCWFIMYNKLLFWNSDSVY